ncbi:glutathione peroxidase [Corynebacterium cystitidis]|uniref:Glutathione peroxidase n=1 Tax=Corynebacterium cystitidis DSM 20524 TaxID=1121357 RepID=A0A1H9W9H8_9CORY|nr:glutathione peroxidase [Corynebacterium cystitidis]WJY83250.1 Hydroperoxy fatty acid reductase gpx2 [Corynebacterium cystitidis DSM 20524]SES30548.1 glutathione peroxidase [Corynebacterium cystitidis DSM 20524]SNV64340.1 glutathione peroxidase [Corynebacterium cystitidis]
MTIRDTQVTLNDGTDTTLNEIAGDNLILLVNTASECGLKTQFEQLANLQDTYGSRGLTVIGTPSNQFKGQEPLSDAEIATKYQDEYNVNFPLLAKLEVNGGGAHPIYQELVKVADEDGEAGDVQWNFEKFIIAPNGDVVARVRPMTAPDDPLVIQALEENLPR